MRAVAATRWRPPPRRDRRGERPRAGPARDHPVRVRRPRPRPRWRRWPAAPPMRSCRALTAAAPDGGGRRASRPGFAYLDGLPDVLRAVPRRARPRPAVPAGSVALANGHAAVYPTASPGGWQLVGRTGCRALLARAARPTPRWRRATACTSPWPGRATGRPAPVAAAAVVAPARRPRRARGRGARAACRRPGRRPPGRGRRGRPARGPGRPGVLHSGQPPGRQRARAGRARAHRRRRPAALPGRLPCRRRRRGARRARRRPAVPGRPGAAARPRASCSRSVGCGAGCRTYVAVAGGVLGPAVFGSCASDELCGLGAGPLARRARPLRRALGAAARRPPGRGRCQRGRGRRRRGRCAWCRARTPSGSSPTSWRGSPRRRSASAATATGSGSGCGRRATPLRPPATAGGRARLPGRGDRCGAGAAGRRPGHPHARPRHARRLPGASPWWRPPTTACSASARRARAVASRARSASTRPGRRGAPAPPLLDGAVRRPLPARRGLSRRHGQSSLTAVPTPMTTTTTRRAGAGRARARRAPM